MIIAADFNNVAKDNVVDNSAKSFNGYHDDAELRHEFSRVAHWSPPPKPNGDLPRTEEHIVERIRAGIRGTRGVADESQVLAFTHSRPSFSSTAQHIKPVPSRQRRAAVVAEQRR